MMRSSWRKRRARRATATALILAVFTSFASADEKPEVAFVDVPGKVEITIGGQPFAIYSYVDPDISRPYFANVRVPGGVQVTRHHPPIAGQDRMDHPAFHPGIWMAFGVLNGSDNWRNKARVVHEEFAEKPQGGMGEGGFAVRNRYLDQEDPTKAVCDETCRLRVLARPAGSLIVWDSTFQSDREFYFGDQEEMGLGVRVATPLRVETKATGDMLAGTGTILDANGRRNEAEIWGNATDWCDYSGVVNGSPAGMTIFCHPDNFAPSRFHVRDYGFLTANPFARKAFRQGDENHVVVKPGETLRLRYGVLVHGGSEKSGAELAAAYKDYVDLAGK